MSRPTMPPRSSPPHPPPPRLPCHPTCPPHPPGPGAGGMRPPDNRVLISVCTTVPVLILIIIVLVTVFCCWFYHRKQRRELHDAIKGKGGVIFLSEELQRAKQEGRILFNVSLVNVRDTTHAPSYI